MKRTVQCFCWTDRHTTSTSYSHNKRCNHNVQFLQNAVRGYVTVKVVSM